MQAYCVGGLSIGKHSSCLSEKYPDDHNSRYRELERHFMISQDFYIIAYFLKTFTFFFVFLSHTLIKLAQKNLESGNDLLVTACKVAIIIPNNI